MKETSESSEWQIIRASSAPAPAERAGSRKNGDGMDQTFVKDTQHDVNGDQGREEKQRQRGERGLIQLRGPGEAARDAGGHVQFLLRPFDQFRALAERSARSEIRGQRHRRELPLVIHREISIARTELGDGRQWHSGARAVGGLDVNLPQRIGIQLKFRVYFEDDMVLAVLLVDHGNLPLSERVVKRVVNIGRH